MAWLVCCITNHVQTVTERETRVIIRVQSRGFVRDGWIGLPPGLTHSGPVRSGLARSGYNCKPHYCKIRNIVTRNSNQINRVTVQYIKHTQKIATSRLRKKRKTAKRQTPIEKEKNPCSFHSVTLPTRPTNKQTNIPNLVHRPINQLTDRFITSRNGIYLIHSSE